MGRRDIELLWRFPYDQKSSSNIERKWISVAACVLPSGALGPITAAKMLLKHTAHWHCNTSNSVQEVGRVMS
jgi:hypothetical protein